MLIKQLRILIFSLSIFTIQIGISQSLKFDWAILNPYQQAYIGTLNLTDMILDSSGNIITVGIFSGEFDFDPSPATHKITSAGVSDIYIQKLDSNGSLIWVKTIDTQSQQGLIVKSVVSDNTGNIIVYGSFSGTVDFDLNGGIHNLTTPPNQSMIYILSLSSTGSFNWVVGISGAFNSSWASNDELVCDIHNNLYLIGFFRGTVDFDPGPGVSSLTSRGYQDEFLLRLNPNGEFNWVKQWGSVDSESIYDLTIDHSNNLLLLGDFSGTMAIDPNSSTVFKTSNGIRDLFIVKLDSLGIYKWGHTIGGNIQTSGRLIKTDSQGNVYLRGEFQGTVDFDPDTSNTYIFSSGNKPFFIQKLDSNGAFIWIKKMGYQATCFEIDTDDNLYFSGYCYPNINFNLDSGVYHVPANQVINVFIQKLNPLGNNIYAKSFGGDDNMKIVNFIIDSLGQVLMNGWTTGKVDFNPNYEDYILGNHSTLNGFITNLIPCVPDTEYIVVTACDSYLWHDGSKYTSSVDTLSFTLENENGCDSVVFLDLTIVHVNLIIERNGNTVTAKAQNATFQWINCDNNSPVPGANTALFTLPNLDRYAVEITQNGCVDTSSCHSLSIVGATEVAISQKIEIYPNPTQDFISIDLERVNAKKVSLLVTDLTGQIVYQKEIRQKNAPWTEQIDLTKLVTGLYFIKITVNEQEHTFNISKL